MIINDIEFALRMWIDDVDGKTLLDEVFDSFEEMNEYIKETWKEPQNGDMTATFSPVEVVNGKPEEAVSLLYDIYPYMPLESSEIEGYIFDIKADFKRIAEQNERMDAQTAFVPQEEAEDYERKKSHLKEIAYICPYFFGS